MNPNAPLPPEKEQEARLPALLLGELSEAEALALRRAMEQDPRLAALFERLKQTVALVREAAADTAEQTAAPPAPLKLSEDRRQKLLTQFKTVAIAPPPGRRVSWWIPMSAAAAVVAVIGARVLAPGSFSRRTLGESRFAGMESKNRWKGGAPEELAVIRKEPQSAPGDSATRTDQADYYRDAADKSVDQKSHETQSVGKPVTLERPRKGGEKQVGITTSGVAAETALAYAVPKEPVNSITPDSNPQPAWRGLPSEIAVRRPKAGEIFLPPDGTAADGRTAQSEFRSYVTDLNSTVNGPGGAGFAGGGVRGGTGGGGLGGYAAPVSVPRGDSAGSGVEPMGANVRGFFDDQTIGLPQSEALGVPEAQQERALFGVAGRSLMPAEQASRQSEALDRSRSDPGRATTPLAGIDVGGRFGETGKPAEARSVAEKAEAVIAPPSDHEVRLLARVENKPVAVPELSVAQLATPPPAEPAVAPPVSVVSVPAGQAANFEAPKALKEVAGERRVVEELKDRPVAGDAPDVGRLFQREDAAVIVDRNPFGLKPPALVTTPANPAATALDGFAVPVQGQVDASAAEAAVRRPDADGNSVKKQARLNEAERPAPEQMAWQRLMVERYGLKRKADDGAGAVGSEVVQGPVAETAPADPRYAEAKQTVESLQKVRDGLVLRIAQQTVDLALPKSSIVNGNPDDVRSEPRKEAASREVSALEGRLAEQDRKLATAREELERLQPKPEAAPAPQLEPAAVAAQEPPAPPKSAVPPPIPQPESQTRENAFSTFSLNVSDVSFKLAAASLEKGILPEPASVRSEEFINAFDYRDPEPPAGVPVAFAWDRARDPFAHNRDLLRFSLKTAAAGRQPGRPLNLVLLLDNSGSMERADRVRIIHEALRSLAAQLQPQDRFSVVTFARTARLFVDGVAGSQAGAVAEQLGGLTPQGGTNLEDAMNLAYQTALRHYLAAGVNRVVLLTDGAANLGNVEPEALKQKVEAHRKQGVALDCFGIGWEGYNDDLLEVLSRNGDGRYGFINSPEEAASEFAGQLAGALHVAASDVKVQVEFNPTRVTAWRQVGYAKHQLTKEQFRDNTVDAAEIGAAESGNAVYVVEVNPGGSGALGVVRVRYKVPGTTDYEEHEWPVPYQGNAIPLEQAGPALRLAATAAAFSEWLASSPFAGEVNSDRLLAQLSGVPGVYGADARPTKLEWMIRQAKAVSGK